jgi:uncharacterized protein (TIGR02271 family)
MAEPDPLYDLIGRNAMDVSGHKIGKIGQLYVDDQTDQPQWITVRTGMFDGRESFAPLDGARIVEGDLVLAVSKDAVKGAPNLPAGGHLAEADNDALFDYYAAFLTTAPVVGRPGTRTQDSVGNAGEFLIRSEERLHVGTERVQSGRARLRKYVVTETVTETVALRHQEVHIEREPITEANRDAALQRGHLLEEAYEVILHSERPVVSKEVVPVELVRLTTDTVPGQQVVNETVRSERIDGLEIIAGAPSVLAEDRHV